MYKVDLQTRELIPLEPTGLTALGLTEHFDLQGWIEKSPEILREDLLVIGKGVTRSSDRRLDLLCIDKSASLVVVELKRDDSGHSVEWQAIKYASYCSTFSADEVYQRYAAHLQTSAEQARHSIEEFIDVDLDNLNKSQRIILVSREFDSEVLAAVFWLRDFGIDIQCTRLSAYSDVTGQIYVSPETIVPLPEAKEYIEKKQKKLRTVIEQPEWSGYWFVSVGEGDHRTWHDCREYGFVGAGQGAKYSDALKRLSAGDKIYAYIKGRGYVGFGVVTREAEVDPARSEWAVGVDWIATVPSAEAKTFTGVFANQNIACKLRHEETLKFVRQHFGS